MRSSKLAISLAMLSMLGGCGGTGGTFSPSPTPSSSATPTPTPTTGTGPCSLDARQSFVDDVLGEWYLFPALLANVNHGGFTDLQSYIDARVAPARAQNRDRYFTYVTSIAEENAFFQQGASAGFGFRLNYDTANRRVFVVETFEGTSALGANIDRGSEILGIGTSANNIQSVNSLMANGGTAAVVEAFGPTDAGVTRVLRFRDASGVEREASVTKTTYELDPVSNRYGARIINDGGTQVGYINLRTFIDTADPNLRAAFADFRAAGVTRLVVDLRYNGGGAISIAELFGDMMGRNLGGQVFDRVTWRASKASRNSTYLFNPQPQSIAPTRIAFIGTRSTASASEMVINGMQPYLGTNMALVGENTFGKPVGQSAFDLAACDDRLRALTIQLENAAGNGEYFDGLAFTVPNTCRASDDLTHQLGDPDEGMLSVALDFLAGRACTPIAGGAATTQRGGDDGLLALDLPDTVAQRETPGLH